jgi:hypothetical protein
MSWLVFDSDIALLLLPPPPPLLLLLLLLQVGRRAGDEDFNVPEAASTTYM